MSKRRGAHSARLDSGFFSVKVLKAGPIRHAGKLPHKCGDLLGLRPRFGGVSALLSDSPAKPEKSPRSHSSEQAKTIQALAAAREECGDYSGLRSSTSNQSSS